MAEQRAGYFPDRLEELRRLPGVGRSTAGALMSFAYHRDTPILDTNVARVLSRYFGLDRPAGGGTPALWATAQAVIPTGRAHLVNQGLMDLGAMVCTARVPRCLACPVRRGCAFRTASLKAKPRPSAKVQPSPGGRVDVRRGRPSSRTGPSVR